VLFWNAQPVSTTGGLYLACDAAQKVPHGLVGASVTDVLSAGSGWITAGSNVSSMSYPPQVADPPPPIEASVSVAVNVPPTATTDVGAPVMLKVAPLGTAVVGVGPGVGVSVGEGRVPGPHVIVALPRVMSKSTAFESKSAVPAAWSPGRGTN
jgi:hypothetical protein